MLAVLSDEIDRIMSVIPLDVCNVSTKSSKRPIDLF